MRIRPAITKDLTQLCNLEEALFTKENYPLSYGSFYYHIKNSLLYVVEEQSQIIAYTLTLIKRKKAKIYSFGVSTHFRGKGIASLLLEEILKELQELGFKAVVLEVRSDNIYAINLYKKFGFVITKRLPSFYLDNCDAYLMEYNFASETL